MTHFLPQLSDFVPLKNGVYIFRAQTGKKAEHTVKIAHTKMSFDEIFDLAAGVYFHFLQ